MNIKEKLRPFVAKHEIALSRIWHAAICLMGQLSILTCFPDKSPLNHPLVVALIVLVSAFIPLSATVLIFIFLAMVHMAMFSISTMITAGVILFIGFLICAYYQSDAKYNMILLPVFYQMRIPFCIPMASALTGTLNDVTAVIFGSFEAYFLKLVILNKAALMDKNGDVSVFSLVLEQMLKSRAFYCFLIAQIAMFLVVYIVRTRNIDHSWMFGVGFGGITSFAIMLIGSLFFNSGEDSLMTFIELLVTVLLGFLMSYFFVDLDYSRPERVQFEDDDYVYYVTAIPKAKLPEENRTVTHITGKKPDRKEKE